MSPHDPSSDESPISYEIQSSGPEHDEGIRRLAEAAQLSVNPTAERAQPLATLHVACSPKGDVLGFVLGRMVVDELEILDVCVDARVRRRGLARALLVHHLDQAKAGGALTATLEVRASNHAAQALYRSFGFEQVGLRPRYYAGGEDALLFRCCLGTQR